MRTLPRLSRVSPAIDSRIVVLPAPEVPKIARRSPIYEVEARLDCDLPALDLEVHLEQRRRARCSWRLCPCDAGTCPRAPQVGEYREGERGDYEQQSEGQRAGQAEFLEGDEYLVR